jgi:dethiobiotin synthase
VIQLFVTGTDTGVGKTTVACALLAAARARGLRVLAMKPIETGCALDADGRSLLPADALALERACRGPRGRLDTASASRAPEGATFLRAPPRDHDPALQSPRAPTLDQEGVAATSRAEPHGAKPRGADDARHLAAPLSNVYRFAAPLAPAVAAEMEGAAVELAPVVRAVDRLRSLAPDLLLVEGAGGLLVPLSASTDMADLAAALDMPLLVVARDGLGTINHTLLTLEAAAARGLRVAGVVLCAATPVTSDRDAARNAEEIARRGRVPVLGRLGPLSDLEPSTLIESAEAQLRLDPLLGPPITE